MRMLTPRIVLMFSALALLIGCDPELKQPILEIVSPPQDSLKKARAAMKRVSERRAEVHRKAEKTNDFSTIFTASEDIFKEELGFRQELWVDLVDIYRQEHLENTELFEGLENLQNAFAEKLAEGTLEKYYFHYISAFDEIIVEYLRLSFEFPEKSEEELFILFRQSIRDQKAVIIFP